MEKELNIAAILKDKPQNTRLWSPIFGDVYLKDVTDVNNNMIRITHHGVDNIFMNNGKVWADGECVVFPSKEMRDWRKFSWKKGDVLVSNDGKREVLFKTWENDSYTKFVGLHCLIFNDNEEVEYDNGTTVFNTNAFKGIEAEDVAQTYINTVEERLGGKLNRETLEIEKPKPEFKDGDIAFADFGNTQNVFIISGKTDLSEGYNSFISLDLSGLTLIIEYRTSFFKKDLCKLRLATEEEKQQLFSALEKEGKRWNPDTKSIEDLPKKCEFKPMDWCLMKDSTKYWELCQFAYTRKVHGTTIYSAVGGLIYYKCIPYNEETKHLLGTTDEWEGGE